MKRNTIVTQRLQSSQPIPLILSSTPKPSGSCSCGCSEVHAQLCDNTVHYASWRCVECRSFRGWVPKPTNLTAKHDEDKLIEALLSSGLLNNWESTFCQSLKEHRKRSPRQREILQAIAKKLGGAL